MGKCLFMRKGETHTAPKQGLPSGYTELAYIQSSGTQYINTGLKPNQNTRIVMHVNPISITANAWAFGGRNADGTNGKGVFFSYSSESLWNAVYYESGSSSEKSFSGISPTADLNIDYDKNTCTINGVSVNFTVNTFQSNFNLALLACLTGGVTGRLSAKLYSCQIYDNGTLVRDFKPCISASGEVGLFDMVNQQFYGNAGAGVFTGSEVA